MVGGGVGDVQTVGALRNDGEGIGGSTQGVVGAGEGEVGVTVSGGALGETGFGAREAPQARAENQECPPATDHGLSMAESSRLPTGNCFGKLGTT